MFPGLDLYYAGYAQRFLTADWNLDDKDRDLSDMSVQRMEYYSVLGTQDLRDINSSQCRTRYQVFRMIPGMAADPRLCLDTLSMADFVR